MSSGKWAGSNRRAELPPDWEKIRRRIFERDNWRCTAMTPFGRCLQVATDCDHVGSKHDHSDENLTSLCADHHKAKTALQGPTARRERREAKKRPPEIHPGLRRPLP